MTRRVSAGVSGALDGQDREAIRSRFLNDPIEDTKVRRNSAA